MRAHGRTIVEWTGIPRRRSEFVRIARVAIVTTTAVMLHPASQAGAQTGRSIEISIDYDCDCGSRNGEAIQRLEESGDHTDIKVRSKSYWNASRLILEAGVTYRFEPSKQKSWKDLERDVDVDGWWPEGGWLAWFMAVARPLLRAPDQKLFQLMGLIYRRCDDSGRGCATQFAIGKKGRTIRPSMAGEFCAYANDLPFKYGNNSGEIVLRITRE